LQFRIKAATAAVVVVVAAELGRCAVGTGL